MYAVAERALREIEPMISRPLKEIFEQNRTWRDEHKTNIQRFIEDGTAGLKMK